MPNLNKLTTILKGSSNLRDLYDIERGRESLLRFMMHTHRNYRPQWFHKAICNKCDQILAQGNRNLMIFMPPRHGKTEIISRYLPAYVLGRWPNDSVMATSYAAELAAKNNRDVQRVIDSDKFRDIFPDIGLFGKNIRTVAYGTYMRNSEMFEIVNHHGYYKCAGVGGGIMGMGFSKLGIIDDPVKNREEAESKTTQDKVLDWYTSTFLTRREKGACVVIIMTRWNKNDLAGKLLAIEPDKWETMHFPAIMSGHYADRHDSDIRVDGEALWPESYSAEFLSQFQGNKYEWDALFQQMPVARGGNIVNREWFGLVDDYPHEGEAIRFWDLAGTPKEVSKRNDPDFTASALVVYYGGDYHIIDVTHHRETPAVTSKIIYETAERDQKLFPDITQVWEEEGGASGKFVTSFFNKLLAKFLRYPYRTDKAKEWYVDRLANKVETGNVKVLNRDWLQSKCDGSTFFDEVEDFPKGKHDDRLDVAAKAVFLLAERVGSGEYLEAMYTVDGMADAYETEQALF